MIIRQSFVVGLANEDFIPEIRPDVVVRHYGNEAIAWSGIQRDSALLDPVAAVVMQIIDGTASVAELIGDVVEAVGVDRDTASAQIGRSLGLLDGTGLLVSSAATAMAPLNVDRFAQPPSL